MLKRHGRTIALILVFTVLALSMAACAGKFSLSHKLLNWNLGLNKWLGSFLLFLFIIIPVYGVCLLVDWIVLNVIEFYSGSNPVGASTAPVTKTATIDGRDILLTLYPGDGVNLDLSTEKPDGSAQLIVVRTTADGVAARFVGQEGASLIAARPGPDGSVERCVEDRCRTMDSEEQAATLDRIKGLESLLARCDD